MMRNFTDLSKIPTFFERFEYLKLDGQIGIETFGVDRYLNQILYKSREWKRARDIVLIRDNGCDLGIEGCEIFGKVIIHHINPITIDQVMERDPMIFDPEYLISVSFDTHNAIHYANKDMLAKGPIERMPYDTCPWR